MSGDTKGVSWRSENIFMSLVWKTASEKKDQKQAKMDCKAWGEGDGDIVSLSVGCKKGDERFVQSVVIHTESPSSAKKTLQEKAVDVMKDSMRIAIDPFALGAKIGRTIIDLLK
jgi:hypothetical protein